METPKLSTLQSTSARPTRGYTSNLSAAIRANKRRRARAARRRAQREIQLGSITQLALSQYAAFLERMQT